MLLIHPEITIRTSAILFENLTPNKFPTEKGGKTELCFSFEDRDYRAEIKRVEVGNEAGDYSNITNG